MIEEHGDAVERLEALERERVKNSVAEARWMCRSAMAALQTHLLLHGCGHTTGSRPHPALYDPSSVHHATP